MRGPWDRATPRCRYGSLRGKPRALQRQLRSGVRTRLLLRWRRCITSRLGGVVMRRARRLGAAGWVWTRGGQGRATQRLTPSLGHGDLFTPEGTLSTTTRGRLIGTLLHPKPIPAVPASSAPPAPTCHGGAELPSADGAHPVRWTRNSSMEQPRSPDRRRTVHPDERRGAHSGPVERNVPRRSSLMKTSLGRRTAAHSDLQTMDLRTMVVR